MKQSVILMIVLTLAGPLAVFAATLQNTDSQEYELLTQEPGWPYANPYRIIAYAKVTICYQGCEMTFLSTGLTVKVSPNDSVVINYRVMNVDRSVSERGGW